VIQDIVSNLAVTNKNLVSHLSALSECALSCPDAFENKGEKIIEFILRKVINAESPSSKVSFISASLIRSCAVLLK
jgi:hypothetical protein